MEWKNILPVDPSFPARKPRKIDTRLSLPLSALPASVVPPPDPVMNLAVRNIMRGKHVGIPSGQQVAQAMRAPVLSNATLGLSSDPGWGHEAPLWYYVLKEAELPPYNAERLGPVGGRIVAEVLVGLLQRDPNSYLYLNAAWKPAPPVAPAAGQFGFVDLLRYAGLPSDASPHACGLTAVSLAPSGRRKRCLADRLGTTPGQRRATSVSSASPGSTTSASPTTTETIDAGANIRAPASMTSSGVVAARRAGYSCSQSTPLPSDNRSTSSVGQAGLGGGAEGEGAGEVLHGGLELVGLRRQRGDPAELVEHLDHRRSGDLGRHLGRGDHPRVATQCRIPLCGL